MHSGNAACLYWMNRAVFPGCDPDRNIPNSDRHRLANRPGFCASDWMDCDTFLSEGLDSISKAAMKSRVGADLSYTWQDIIRIINAYQVKHFLMDRSVTAPFFFTFPKKSVFLFATPTIILLTIIYKQQSGYLMVALYQFQIPLYVQHLNIVL